MYTAETIQSGNKYTLWLEYEPDFLLQAKTVDGAVQNNNLLVDNWCGFTKE